jgi:hypothetical protein
MLTFREAESTSAALSTLWISGNKVSESAFGNDEKKVLPQRREDAAAAAVFDVTPHVARVLWHR